MVKQVKQSSIVNAYRYLTQIFKIDCIFGTKMAAFFSFLETMEL